MSGVQYQNSRIYVDQNKFIIENKSQDGKIELSANRVNITNISFELLQQIYINDSSGTNGQVIKKIAGTGIEWGNVDGLSVIQTANGDVFSPSGGLDTSFGSLEIQKTLHLSGDNVIPQTSNSSGSNKYLFIDSNNQVRWHQFDISDFLLTSEINTYLVSGEDASFTNLQISGNLILENPDQITRTDFSLLVLSGDTVYYRDINILNYLTVAASNEFFTARHDASFNNVDISKLILNNLPSYIPSTRNDISLLVLNQNNTVQYYDFDISGYVTNSNSGEILRQNKDASFGNIDINNIKIGNNTGPFINITNNTIQSSTGTDNEFNTLIIDPNPQGNDGKVIIKGNLQVDGSQTNIYSEDIDISSAIIKLGSNLQNENQIPNSGIGITISNDIAYLKYKYNFNGYSGWLLSGDLSVNSVITNKLKFDGSINYIPGTDNSLLVLDANNDVKHIDININDYVKKDDSANILYQSYDASFNDISFNKLIYTGTLSRDISYIPYITSTGDISFDTSSGIFGNIVASGGNSSLNILDVSTLTVLDKFTFTGNNLTINCDASFRGTVETQNITVSNSLIVGKSVEFQSGNFYTLSGYYSEASFNNIDISNNLRFTSNIPTDISRYPVFIDNSGLLKYSNTIYTSITAGSFNKVSDDRLKHNEINISNGLEIVKQLKPVTYQKSSNLISSDYVGPVIQNYTKEAGLIAQEVYNINDIRYTVNKGNEIEPYTLKYDDIFIYGLAGLKELDTIVQNQNTIINDLSFRLHQKLNNTISSRPLNEIEK